MRELMTLQSRGYTVGFLDGNAGPEAQNYDHPGSHGDWRYAGLVRGHKTNRLVVEVKHKISCGMVLEALSPYQFDPIILTISEIFDATTQKNVESVSAGKIGQLVEIKLNSKIIKQLPPLSVLRVFDPEK